MNELQINGKQVNIYISKTVSNYLPLIILNSYDKNGEEIFNICKKLNCHDFILVTISNLDWNSDMTPWPGFNLNQRFKGTADTYLNELINDIIPKVKNNLNIKISEYIIAGYSLAGLFALYSVYKTDVFSKVISASGSLWYPNFLDFIKVHNISKNITKIYLSLGNKESKTKNKVLNTVKDNTKEIEKIYLNQNIKTIYEENEGGHFKNASLRIAKGIKWILEGK